MNISSREKTLRSSTSLKLSSTSANLRRSSRSGRSSSRRAVSERQTSDTTTASNAESCTFTTVPAVNSNRIRCFGRSILSSWCASRVYRSLTVQWQMHSWFTLVRSTSGWLEPMLSLIWKVICSHHETSCFKPWEPMTNQPHSTQLTWHSKSNTSINSCKEGTFCQESQS